jgi:hypothetical protein
VTGQLAQLARVPARSSNRQKNRSALRTAESHAHAAAILPVPATTEKFGRG